MKNKAEKIESSKENISSLDVEIDALRDQIKIFRSRIHLLLSKKKEQESLIRKLKEKPITKDFTDHEYDEMARRSVEYSGSCANRHITHFGGIERTWGCANSTWKDSKRNLCYAHEMEMRREESNPNKWRKDKPIIEDEPIMLDDELEID